MSLHAPPGYSCPFCRNTRGEPAEHPLEVVYRDDDVFVKMNPKWRPRNPGSLLVIPIRHIENIYELPPDLGCALITATRSAAMALKGAFGCEGVSVRQHNEPAGGQDVWHFHIHVIARRLGDDFDRLDGEWVPAERIERCAEELRRAWPTS